MAFNALTPFTLTSAATTNLTLIKAGGGKLMTLFVNNENAAWRCLKLFDAAATGDVTLGTTVPFLKFPIPPGGGIALGQDKLGVPFTAGLVMALTVERTLAGNTAVAASEHVVNIGTE